MRPAISIFFKCRMEWNEKTKYRMAEDAILMIIESLSLSDYIIDSINWYCKSLSKSQRKLYGKLYLLW